MRPVELIRNLLFWGGLVGLPWGLLQLGLSGWIAVPLGVVLAFALPFLVPG